MYSDTSKLRHRVVKLRLSDVEYRLVQALVEYTGGEMAPLCRQLVLEQAAALTDGDPTGVAPAAAALQ